MFYDDLDDGRFNGTSNTHIEYEDCTYTGTSLDTEGIGYGNLIYKKSKMFSGKCLNGKAMEGTLSTFRGNTNYTCEYRNFHPYDGRIFNENEELEEYENGKKITTRGKNTLQALSLIRGGSVLAAAAGLSYTLLSPNSEPELEQVPIDNTVQPIHDKYIPEGKTPEELRAEYGDLTKSCTNDQIGKIRLVQFWLDENIDKIDTIADRIWETPDGTWQKGLIINQVAFPSQFQFETNTIYNKDTTHRFVCPGVSDRYLGLSNFDEEGRIAIYDATLPDPCTLANTVLHEILHKNSDRDHPYDSQFNQTDWIYYTGDIAEDVCRKTWETWRTKIRLVSPPSP